MTLLNAHAVSSDDQLRAILLQSETYEPRFRADRANKDAELMAAIRSIKQQPITLGKNQAAVVSFPIQSPHGNDAIPCNPAALIHCVGRCRSRYFVGKKILAPLNK